ncbi:unnamed protein product, partial [Symbiodinium natans]
RLSGCPSRGAAIKREYRRESDMVVCLLTISCWAIAYEGDAATSKKLADRSAAMKLLEDPSAQSKIEELRRAETRKQAKQRSFTKGKLLEGGGSSATRRPRRPTK